ncbi:nucleoporin Nup60 [Schizosaccharomyces octosporus yFS286]|uniref:Nucleoporin Nup60 n=1 Tax=Schizosaccharomyces octosporus (strain yFS286) TaxID=483514 RepID=S9Q0J2_SCHOY|nr:nucleoporin Nup60 [Schizosaccharomyces octosporus yFS286]EPX73717.1 nucleoporin Nup60 [Schizosaccharomyces octosporus yFS286]
MSSGPVRNNRKDKSTHKNKPYDRITESSPLKSPQTPSKSIVQRAKEWLTPSSWKKTIAFLSKIPSEESEDEDRDLMIDSSEEIKPEDHSFQKQSQTLESPKTPAVPRGSSLPPISNQDSPNQLLAMFFSNKGNQPLNEVEREGVMSLLSRNGSPASTTHHSPSVPSQQFSTPKYTANPHRAVSSESRIQTSGSFHPSPNSSRQWPAFRSTFSPILGNSKLPNVPGSSPLSAQKTSYYGPTMSTPFRKNLQRKRHSTTPVGASKLISLASSTTPDFVSKRSKNESFNGSFTANEDSFSTVPASSPFPPTQSTPQQKTPSRTAANLMSILESKESPVTSSPKDSLAKNTKASYISPYARPGVTTSRRRHTLAKEETRPLKTIEEKHEVPAVEALNKSSNLQTYKPDFTPQFLKESSIPETKKEPESVSKNTDADSSKTTPVFKFTAPSSNPSTSMFSQSTKPTENLTKERPAEAAQQGEAIDVDMEDSKGESKKEGNDISSQKQSEKQPAFGGFFANQSESKLPAGSVEAPKTTGSQGFSFGSLANKSTLPSAPSVEQKKAEKSSIPSFASAESAASANDGDNGASQPTKEPKPFSFASLTASPKVDEKPKETPAFTFGIAGKTQASKDPKPFSFAAPTSSPKVKENLDKAPVFTFGSTGSNISSSTAPAPVQKEESVPEKVDLPQFPFTILPKKDITGNSEDEKALSVTDEIPSFTFSTLDKKNHSE